MGSSQNIRQQLRTGIRRWGRRIISTSALLAFLFSCAILAQGPLLIDEGFSCWPNGSLYVSGAAWRGAISVRTCRLVNADPQRRAGDWRFQSWLRRVTDARATTVSFWTHDSPAPDRSFGWAGLTYERYTTPELDGTRSTVSVFKVSAILIALLSGGLVVPGFVRIIRSQGRKRRAAFVRCASCGYDLTGNTSGICPECGLNLAAGAREIGKAGNKENR